MCQPGDDLVVFGGADAVVWVRRMISTRAARGGGSRTGG